MKLVVVIKDGLDTGKAMNALAHAMLGFGAVSAEDVRLKEYIDADDGVHSSISEMPIIILKASSNKIRNLRRMALHNVMQFVDFTDTMSVGTYKEEYELTKKTREQDLSYWAIVLFGDSELITEWTRKFSLLR